MSAKPWFLSLLAYPNHSLTLLVLRIKQATTSFLCCSDVFLLVPNGTPHEQNGVRFHCCLFLACFLRHFLESAVGSLCLPGTVGSIGSADVPVNVTPCIVKLLVLPCLHPCVFRQPPRSGYYAHALAVKLLKAIPPANHLFSKKGALITRGNKKSNFACQ